MVIIVGAGLAGLACATRLEQVGVEWLLLEAADAPGGRVATEITPEGFRLDRGFQVILDSYRTAASLLDFPALEPRWLGSGALLAGSGGKESRILNPLFHPEGIPGLLFGDAFTLREKMALAAYAAPLLLRSDEALTAREHGCSTMEELRRHGLEGGILEKFLRPFFGGVFLDGELGTDASIFRRDLKKFALGRAFLPARGMGEIPVQLASRLPAHRQRYGVPVESLVREAGRVTSVLLANGERLPCDDLVLATEEPATRRLLGLPEGRSWSEVSTLYFTGSEQLYEGALLVLPEGRGRLVRHFADLTNVAPEYAPEGSRLLTATILNPPDGDLGNAARAEIAAIFPSFASWRFLKEVRIRRALPSQRPGFHDLQPPRRPLSNVLLAGDQVATASIDSALASGLAAADELIPMAG
jgi:phytoene dehydrogenase-like protein